MPENQNPHQTHTIKCAECSRPMQVPHYIKYAICEGCKGTLASTQPRKVVDHLVKAVEQNE